MKAKITDKLVRNLNLSPKRPYYVCDEIIKGFRLVVRPTGTISYILCYRNDHGKSKKFTIGKYGSLTVSQAREIAQYKSAEVKTGTDIQEEKRSTREIARAASRTTLKVFFEEQYRPYCLTHMRSGLKRSKVIERHFVKSWPNRPLSEINSWLVSGWVSEKKRQNYSAAGINHPLAAMKALLRKAEEWGVIETNPLNSYKLLKVDTNTNVRFLSAQEESALRTALAKRQVVQREQRSSYREWQLSRNRTQLPKLPIEDFTDYLMPIVLLALNTGLRRGELFCLKWGDVDFNNKILTVVGESSKSGKTRHIPLNTEAVNTLRKWKCVSFHSELVFTSPVTHGKFDNINKSWKAVLQLANIENFRFHDLRHTFASKLAMKGVDLYTIKELLGHSSVEMTQRYAHLSPNHKSAAVSLL